MSAGGAHRLPLAPAAAPRTVLLAVTSWITAAGAALATADHVGAVALADGSLQVYPMKGEPTRPPPWPPLPVETQKALAQAAKTKTLPGSAGSTANGQAAAPQLPAVSDSQMHGQPKQDPPEKSPQAQHSKQQEAQQEQHIASAMEAEEMVEPLPESVRDHAREVLQRKHSVHHGEVFGHHMGSGLHAITNFAARRQRETAPDYDRNQGNLPKLFLDSVQLLAVTASSYLEETPLGDMSKIKSKNFPHSAGQQADLILADRTRDDEEVAMIEPVTPLAVLYEENELDEPCLSPMWAPGDPVCWNARQVRGQDLRNGTDIEYWMVPAHEDCQIRCSKANWHMMPSQQTLQCDTLVFQNVPAELTCTCCQYWVAALLFMIPTFFVTLVVLFAVLVTGKRADSHQQQRGKEQGAASMATAADAPEVTAADAPSA